MNNLLQCPKKVEIKYHFNEDDEDCSGDFYHAEIYFDGKEVFSLTDEYHDKTTKQFFGFLEACRMIWGTKFPKIKETNKNDVHI